MRDLVPCWWNANTNNDPDGKRGTMDKAAGQPQIGQVGRGIGRIRTTNYFNYEIWDSKEDYRHTAPNWLNMEDMVYNNPASKYYGQPLQKKVLCRYYLCLESDDALQDFLYLKIINLILLREDIQIGMYSVWLRPIY